MVTTDLFIKVYDATFAWINEQLGYGSLVSYWKYIAPYVLSDLKEKAEKEGVWGCFSYWKHTLSSEGLDYLIEYRGKEKLTIWIKDCPRKNMQCKNYCDHCTVMYQAVLEPLGLKYELEKTGEYSCTIKIMESL